MKRFYYLGDSKDIPSYSQDKNRHISLVSGYSLADFIIKNKLAPFDLLILCGHTDEQTLDLWIDQLSREVYIPPVVLLYVKSDKKKRNRKDTSFFSAVLDSTTPVDSLWAELEKTTEINDSDNRGAMGALSQSGTYGLIGNSRAMTEIRIKIKKYAANEMPVLILGESGTGKELIARALHEEGHGSQTSFEAFQVSPVGEDLFESNLFGVRKGAFTGSENRKGLMESARGGVLFLDEIGTLSKGNQISLLRVLEEHSMRPLGSDKLINTDFRLITATNESLSHMVSNGHFRRDLYNRINTLVINVPPLREREEDIILLSEFFLIKENVIKSLTKHARQKLLAHNWPGNVRELLNTLRRAIIESGSRSVIEARDLIIL